jgi:hypothetical protein
MCGVRMVRARYRASAGRQSELDRQTEVDGRWVREPEVRVRNQQLQPRPERGMGDARSPNYTGDASLQGGVIYQFP